MPCNPECRTKPVLKMEERVENVAILCIFCLLHIPGGVNQNCGKIPLCGITKGTGALLHRHFIQVSNSDWVLWDHLALLAIWTRGRCISFNRSQWAESLMCCLLEPHCVCRRMNLPRLLLWSRVFLMDALIIRTAACLHLISFWRRVWFAARISGPEHLLLDLTRRKSSHQMSLQTINSTHGGRRACTRGNSLQRC